MLCLCNVNEFCLETVYVNKLPIAFYVHANRVNNANKKYPCNKTFFQIFLSRTLTKSIPAASRISITGIGFRIYLPLQ